MKRRQPLKRLLTLGCAACCTLLLCRDTPAQPPAIASPALSSSTPPTGLSASQQGFSEPYRLVQVASAETGIVKEVLVREGHSVTAGQPLTVLDNAQHLLQLAIAEANRDAQGELVAAEAESQQRSRRLQAITALFGKGHASEEELARAQAEADIAAAQLRAAQERRQLRSLECDRLAAQIEQRTVRAPFAGVITAIAKQPGEFVGPNDPQVLQLAQLQPLGVLFLLPREQAAGWKVEQPAEVLFLSSNRRARGVIDYVSPLVEPGSGTIAVRVRLENESGQWKAGEPCQLLAKAAPPPPKPAASAAAKGTAPAPPTPKPAPPAAAATTTAKPFFQFPSLWPAAPQQTP